MLMDEGYIKYRAEKEDGEIHFATADFFALNKARDLLFRKQLIGIYPNGIGFGNISMRIGHTDQFIISGSATGGIKRLNKSHYALVTKADIAQNKVYYRGETPASSESMSHAAIYQALPEVNFVIHVHHLPTWKAQKDNLPTISSDTTYGTPEMAVAIRELITTMTGGFGVFVTAGHEEGLFAYGEKLKDTVDAIVKYLK